MFDNYTWQDPALLRQRSLASAQRIATVYGSIDRILSDRLAKGVTIREHGPAPAWTDGSTIFLNTADLPALHPGMRQRDLVAWLGANYHELGHILYSPRSDSTLMDKIRALNVPGLLQTWNLAEDQRQERLMVAQFPTMAAYYLVMCETVLNAYRSDPTTMWPLFAGRRYLPQDLLDLAKAAFVGGVDLADAIAAEIGAYQRLADPAERDHEQAIYHLTTLHRLLMENQLNVPPTCGQSHRVSEEGDSVPAETDTPDASTPAPAKPKPEPKPEQGDDEAEGDEEEGDEGEGDSPSDAPGSDEGEGEGTDTDDGEGKGDGQGEGDDEGTEEGDGSGEGEGHTEGDDDTVHDPSDQGGGRGTGTVRGAKPRIGDLREALREAVSDVLNDPSVQRELDRARSQTQPPKGAMPDSVLDTTPVQAPASLVAIAEEVSKSLSQMVDDVAAAKYRRVEAGKLVPRRYEQGLDRDVWFDRFDPGQQDETSLEVVILADVSGSMKKEVDGAGTISRLDSAAQAAWVIRRATDAVEGKCSVIGYDTSAHAAPSDKPSRTHYDAYPLMGGTTPDEAFKFARGILDGSEATHRMLVVISDGDWNASSMEAFRGMVNEGRYITVVVGLGMSTTQVGRFPGEYRVSAKGCEPLVPLFRSVVTGAFARRLGA